MTERETGVRASDAWAEARGLTFRAVGRRVLFSAGSASFALTPADCRKLAARLLAEADRMDANDSRSGR